MIKPLYCEAKLLHSLINLLQTVLAFNAPTDTILSEFFRSQRPGHACLDRNLGAAALDSESWKNKAFYFKNTRKFGSKERALMVTTVYAILRNYYKLTTALNLTTPVLRPKLAQLIGLCWLQLFDYPIANLKQIKAFDVDYLSTLTLSNLTPIGDNAALGGSATLELPNWLVTLLAAHYSQATLTQLATSLQQTATTDLRVNLLKDTRQSVLASLKVLGIAGQATEFSPFAIRLQDKVPLAKQPLLLSGTIEIQDESSQLAGMLLKPKRGDMVVDFCAGSGGKTLLLGMLMHNTGRIYALDIHAKRLAKLSPRLARSGLSNVYPQLITGLNDNKLKRLHNKIDKVFVDAPCSGLGTLRRNPELKFRHNLATIAELNQKQLAILTAASKLLKVGGHLVYATCSILFEENQAIMQQFLAANPQFTHVSAATTLNESQLVTADGDMLLLPHIHNTDGFFASLITRIS